MSTTVRNAFASNFAAGVVFARNSPSIEPAPQRAPAPVPAAEPIMFREAREGRAKAKPFVTVERPDSAERFRRAS